MIKVGLGTMKITRIVQAGACVVLTAMSNISLAAQVIDDYLLVDLPEVIYFEETDDTVVWTEQKRTVSQASTASTTTQEVTGSEVIDTVINTEAIDTNNHFWTEPAAVIRAPAVATTPAASKSVPEVNVTKKVMDVGWKQNQGYDVSAQARQPSAVVSQRDGMWMVTDPDTTPLLSAEMERELRANQPVPIESPFTAPRPNPRIADGKRNARVGGLTTVRPYTAADYDPFRSLMKWNWDANVSVGEGLRRLTKVLGYTLIIRDTRVGNVYSMSLPYTHRRVRNIDAKTALELLGGPGLMVVVDHAGRTIMHRVKAIYDRKYDIRRLPQCAGDVTYGVMPSGSMNDKVVIVGDQQCVY